MKKLVWLVFVLCLIVSTTVTFVPTVGAQELDSQQEENFRYYQNNKKTVEFMKQILLVKICPVVSTHDFSRMQPLVPKKEEMPLEWKDIWGNPIYLIVDQFQVFLRSSGPDGKYFTADDLLGGMTYSSRADGWQLIGVFAIKY